MALNFLETVKNYFTAEFTNQASNSLDESSSGTAKALSAILPIGLAAALQKATSGNDGTNTIFNMAKEAAGYLHLSPNLSDLHNDEKGSDIPARLLGIHQSQITGAISQYAGIKNSSVSALMTAALPVEIGLLGRHAQQNNLSQSGLSGFLSSQKNNIIQSMPSGLSSLAGIFGLSALGAATSSTTSPGPGRSTEMINTPKKRPDWLFPIIIILIVIALLWYFSRSCNQTKSTESPVTTTNTHTNTDTTSAMKPAATTPESIKVKLPNGKELDAYKGGIEDQLVTFLNSDWKSLSNDSLKNKWFNFDNLNFNTGNAILLPESEKQLDNIAEILKAFPDAKIKIGGYTDVTGDAATNKKLSQDRANAAKSGLDKRGVSKQITGAEGYGSQFAKYPATATEEEKATDRHVSVSVRK